ncbi:MAG: hypothetical protein R2911_26330 [Caldilineaceae bacterium]
MNTQAEMPLSSLQQLQTYLRTRQLLLILDNFEHLLSGTHALVRLLTQAPQVKALVTSRTRLGVRRKASWLLTSCRCRRRAAESPAQALQANLPAGAGQGLPSESEAVAMFVSRAQQLDPSFCVNGETIGPLVQICRLVEGLPLGIELATSMLPLLSCHELVQGIAENLDFLESVRATCHPGQRTPGPSSSVPGGSSLLKSNNYWRDWLSSPAAPFIGTLPLRLPAPPFLCSNVWSTNLW